MMSCPLGSKAAMALTPRNSYWVAVTWRVWSVVRKVLREVGVEGSVMLTGKLVRVGATMVSIPRIGRLRPVPVVRKVMELEFSLRESAIAKAVWIMVVMVMLASGGLGRFNRVEKREVWWGT